MIHLINHQFIIFEIKVSCTYLGFWTTQIEYGGHCET